MAKSNSNIKGLELFEHTFLYTAYADDTTFFLQDKNSVKETIKTLEFFSKYSGLKPNKSKCVLIRNGYLVFHHFTKD